MVLGIKGVYESMTEEEKEILDDLICRRTAMELAEEKVDPNSKLGLELAAWNEVWERVKDLEEVKEACKYDASKHKELLMDYHIVRTSYEDIRENHKIVGRRMRYIISVNVKDLDMNYYVLKRDGGIEVVKINEIRWNGGYLANLACKKGSYPIKNFQNPINSDRVVWLPFRDDNFAIGLFKDVLKSKIRKNRDKILDIELKNDEMMEAIENFYIKEV